MYVYVVLFHVHACVCSSVEEQLVRALEFKLIINQSILQYLLQGTTAAAGLPIVIKVYNSIPSSPNSQTVQLSQ